MAGLRRAGVGVPGSAGLAVIFTAIDLKNPYPARIALYFIIPLICFAARSGRHVSDSASRRS